MTWEVQFFSVILQEKKKMINMMASSLGYISLFHVFLPMCLSTAEGRLSVFTENKSQVFYLRLRL